MRDFLRKETEKHHRYVESLSANKRLLSDPDPHLYQRILQAWLATFYELGGLLSKSHFSRVEVSLKWLQSDLNHLGANLNLNTNLEPKDSDSFRSWGILYVLLGSTLGSQVISSRLKKSKHEYIRYNRRFFTGFGENTRSNWKLFCEELESLSYKKEDIKIAVEGAQLAFHIIGKHLKEASYKDLN